MNTSIQLSIIIVTWNVKDLLQECLQSLTDEPLNVLADDLTNNRLKAEIIVVDNQSSDGTGDMLREKFPEVRLITSPSNIGFAGGNNLGMNASQGDYLLLINPDTKVNRSSLTKLVRYMSEYPSLGVIGPQLLNEDGTVQSSRRRFPTFWTAIFESTWLQWLAPKRILSHYYMHDTNDSDITSVDWLQGAALLVRRAVLSEVGAFDEDFFMYSEELDWQRRIKSAGWEIVYYPEAKIVHYGGKSSEQVFTKRHIYFQTSKVRYFTKHHGRWTGWLLRNVLLGNYIWQLFVETAKWLIGHKRSLRSERIRAYKLVLRSGLRDS